MQYLVVRRNYMTVKGEFQFVQFLEHVMTLEIYLVNLNLIYIRTNLLRMKVRTIRLQMMSIMMQWTMINLIFLIIIKMMIFWS